MNTQEITYNRAKLWQIGLFAFNNIATNMFLILMMYISYYANGVAGIAVVTISLLLTAMRIFDGITDPIIGFFIDKTEGRFGKFRPFMLLGYIIMVASVLVLFNTLHVVPESFRVIYFTLIYGLYIIGYTFQTACTKAAQACLTNDPKQRPQFTLFDGIYGTIMFNGMTIYISNSLVPRHGGFSLSMFHELMMVTIVLSGVFTVLAIVGIAQKDRKEFFGLGGKTVKVKFRDYIDVIKGNRAIQMLVIAASTDKLASTVMGNATVVVVIFGVIAGDYALSGQIAGYTTIPTLLILMIGIQFARKFGQKQALVGATWIAMTFGVILGGILLFGDMTTLSFSNINLFTIAFTVVYILMRAVSGVSNSIVIPMIADCSDYETYKTGRYVPGMMGTLFSFIDKLISSLATTVVGLLLAMVGFSEVLPTVDTPATSTLLYIGVFMYVGIPILGWIASLIAMKFYPLDAAKMDEIQQEIQKIKESAA